MRLGVFGGTFDPPHIAHRIVAQDALETLGLDRVLFVPAAVPPHKRDRPRTAASIRLEMLRVLLGDDPRFEISTLELERDGPSYTIDTLRALRRDRLGASLHLLIGTDQWREFESWREPGAIEELARVCVLGRGGSGALSRPGGRREAEAGGGREAGGGGGGGGGGRGPTLVAVTRIDLSSSEIRRRVAARRSIRYLVPEGVRAIIQREALYGR